MNAQGANALAGLSQFFAARWKGEVPMATLFWRDMLVVGTGLNIAATLAAMALLAAKLPLALALAVHFALTPYNLFLAFAAWRTAELRCGRLAFMWQAAAVVWLIGVLVV